MRDTRYERGFTLAELLVALMVTSIVLTAVATLAYALGAANDATDDTSRKQAQLRYTTLRISDLIRHCRLICGMPGNDLAIWRADDNNDGKINPTELVYLEAGQEKDRLGLLEFSWTGSWELTISETQDINTKTALILACTERRTVLMPECSDVQFHLDDVPPQSRRVGISFNLTENEIERNYQINAALRGWAGNLLNAAADSIITDDD